MYDTIEFKLCRLCLNSSGHLIDVFDENKLEFLVEKVVEELLQLRVSKEADCPWLLCSACLSKLIDFRLFKQRCVECQIVFENRVQRGNLLKGRPNKNGPQKSSTRGSEECDESGTLQSSGSSTILEENVLMPGNYQSTTRDGEYKLCIADEMVNSVQESEVASSMEFVRERQFELAPIPCNDELNQALIVKEEGINIDRNEADRLNNEEDMTGQEETQNVSQVAENDSPPEIILIDLDTDMPQASAEDVPKQEETGEDLVCSGQSQDEPTFQRKRLFRKRKFFNIHKVWEENESYNGYCRKKIKSSIPSSRWTTENSEIPVVTVPDSMEAQTEPSNVQDQPVQGVKGNESEALKAIVSLRETLTGIETRLMCLEGKKSIEEAGARTVSEIRPLKDFPLSNVDELQMVEKKLTNEIYWKQLVQELSHLEGSSAKGFIRCVLAKLMTLTLGSKYSWIGFKKKRVFSTLLLKDVIIDAIAASKWSEISEADAIEHIKVWLRSAKSRANSINKKK
ncbi:uncharacterized protein [Hetaerina americana]|uniref:uncharacterized protein n=1 Tax=Hetaerina americana TaxID=62018 RepID=UPI003A7F1933